MPRSPVSTGYRRLYCGATLPGRQQATTENEMSPRVSLAAAAATALVAMAASAMAQEDQNPWSGWYAGVNLGANWGGSQTRTTVAPGAGVVVIPPADASMINAAPLSDNNHTGFTGGIEGGYGYRAGNVVLGLETDFDAFDIKEQGASLFTSGLLINPPITYTLSHKLSTNWLWTLRPRVGYIAGRWLIYGTGGLALSDVKLKASYADTRIPANVINLSTSQTRAGWTAGGGVGFAISPNWALKVEYLYTDLGTVHAAASPASGFAVLGARSDVKSNVVRMGLDYRF
jgi:outer membrane immunogenic protein